ncbi:MAG: hypothetical protein BGO37_07115 [Cellulomonas sp. 73-92]|uniref:chemotaxis protein CheX n=1 Tax=Cellulomonas sp. 73-92 TaxID=1895740 RepID=UPI000927E66F|nr:chemotaxis protein CheX [Cellulomonas sp. 73-92]OJV78491.1 MAG: hypothetical protein BGO37_07115 [Cellulomonas sp. 73-92]
MSAITADDVAAIAGDVFASMVDGEQGTLAPWPDGVPVDGPDWVAWVDVHGPWTGRAALETSSGAADQLTRALLRLPAAAPVADDDVVDALGELANVVGGNVKALLPEQGTLGLPRVVRTASDEVVAPEDPALHPVQRLPLGWRGRSLVLTVWAADDRQRVAARAAGTGPQEDR